MDPNNRTGNIIAVQESSYAEYGLRDPTVVNLKFLLIVSAWLVKSKTFQSLRRNEKAGADVFRDHNYCAKSSTVIPLNLQVYAFPARP